MSSARGAGVHGRILLRGLELASERGLTGVTLGNLAQRAEMSKSGLFAHFRSKEELQIELLRAAEATLTRDVVEPALRSPAGVSRLRELMRRWMGWSTRSGLPGGCPLYGAAFELDDAAPGPVRDFLLERHREWTGLLSRLVREAVDRGELARDLNIEQFVWRLIGVYLAHHLAQRLCADPNADARGMAAFEDIVACAALAGGGASTPSGAEDEMLR